MEQAKDYLLINQEKNSITTAKSRLSKIAGDVTKLIQGGFSKPKELSDMLKKASGIISDSETLNKQANDLFLGKYLLPSEANATSTATSTIDQATSSDNTIINSEISGTSTATSTGQGGEPLQIPSIKDTIRSSLLKIRDAYQVFIDMSSFVRKELNG